MKVVRIENFENTERHVQATGCTSIRAIVKADNLGFSVHKTEIPKGKPHNWHYKHHLEACYCISGRAELVNLDTGCKYEILPDTIYALDNHDNHTFEALEDTVLISIFNPPVNGTEIHDENGNYTKPE